MRMLTLGEAAALLSLHPKTLARLASQRGIGSKLGREWRFHESDVIALLQPVPRKPNPKRPAPQKKGPKCPSRSTRRENLAAISASGELSEGSPLTRAQAQIIELRLRS